MLNVVREARADRGVADLAQRRGRTRVRHRRRGPRGSGRSDDLQAAKIAGGHELAARSSDPDAMRPRKAAVTRVRGGAAACADRGGPVAVGPTRTRNPECAAARSTSGSTAETGPKQKRGVLLREVAVGDKGGQQHQLLVAQGLRGSPVAADFEARRSAIARLRGLAARRQPLRVRSGWLAVATSSRPSRVREAENAAARRYAWRRHAGARCSWKSGPSAANATSSPRAPRRRRPPRAGAGEPVSGS